MNFFSIVSTSDFAEVTHRRLLAVDLAASSSSFFFAVSDTTSPLSVDGLIALRGRCPSTELTAARLPTACPQSTSTLFLFPVRPASAVPPVSMFPSAISAVTPAAFGNFFAADFRAIRTSSIFFFIAFGERGAERVFGGLAIGRDWGYSGADMTDGDGGTGTFKLRGRMGDNRSRGDRAAGGGDAGRGVARSWGAG